MTEKLRNVVVAMDGSKDSETALDFYIRNIRQEDKECLMILHCVHHKVVYTDQSFWSPTDPEGIFTEFREDNEKGKRICQSIERKLKDSKVNGTVIQLEGGEPGHIIVEKANELGASVIIVGSRGLGTIRRTLLGSVSDFIVHHAKCPVLICRH